MGKAAVNGESCRKRGEIEGLKSTKKTDFQIGVEDKVKYTVEMGRHVISRTVA